MSQPVLERRKVGEVQEERRTMGRRGRVEGGLHACVGGRKGGREVGREREIPGNYDRFVRADSFALLPHLPDHGPRLPAKEP